MIRTVEVIQTDIQSLQKARIALLSGKMVQSLTIGSDDLQRRYSYQEISLPMIDRGLVELYDELRRTNAGEGLDGFSGKVRTHALKIHRGF